MIVWVRFDQIRLTLAWHIRQQPLNCHYIVIQILLNPDLCTKVCDITFSQMSLTHFNLTR